jgi:hypothetical protein
MLVTYSQPSTTEVMHNIVEAIASLQLLEAIYGFISENGCRIVGIADELSNEQRDRVWDIYWQFQGKYPQLDIEVSLIQRYGRPLTEIFHEGDLAVVKHEFKAA